MPGELIWRYSLATLLIFAALGLGVAAAFGYGYGNPASPYELEIPKIVTLKGSSLTLASIVIFIGAAILLLRTNGKSKEIQKKPESKKPLSSEGDRSGGNVPHRVRFDRAEGGAVALGMPAKHEFETLASWLQKIARASVTLAILAGLAVAVLAINNTTFQF